MRSSVEVRVYVAGLADGAVIGGRRAFDRRLAADQMYETSRKLTVDHAGESTTG
jgi:hypothetical protein